MEHALTIREIERLYKINRTDGQIIGKLWSVNRGRSSRLKAGFVR